MSRTHALITHVAFSKPTVSQRLPSFRRVKIETTTMARSLLPTPGSSNSDKKTAIATANSTAAEQQKAKELANALAYYEQCQRQKRGEPLHSAAAAAAAAAEKLAAKKAPASRTPPRPTRKSTAPPTPSSVDAVDHSVSSPAPPRRTTPRRTSSTKRKARDEPQERDLGHDDDDSALSDAAVSNPFPVTREQRAASRRLRNEPRLPLPTPPLLLMDEKTTEEKEEAPPHSYKKSRTAATASSTTTTKSAVESVAAPVSNNTKRGEAERMVVQMTCTLPPAAVAPAAFAPPPVVVGFQQRHSIALPAAPVVAARSFSAVRSTRRNTTATEENSSSNTLPLPPPPHMVAVQNTGTENGSFAARGALRATTQLMPVPLPTMIRSAHLSLPTSNPPPVPSFSGGTTRSLPVPPPMVRSASPSPPTTTLPFAAEPTSGSFEDGGVVQQVSFDNTESYDDLEPVESVVLPARSLKELLLPSSSTPFYFKDMQQQEDCGMLLEEKEDNCLRMLDDRPDVIEQEKQNLSATAAVVSLVRKVVGLYSVVLLTLYFCSVNHEWSTLSLFNSVPAFVLETSAINVGASPSPVGLDDVVTQTNPAVVSMEDSWLESTYPVVETIDTLVLKTEPVVFVQSEIVVDGIVENTHISETLDILVETEKFSVSSGTITSSDGTAELTLVDLENNVAATKDWSVSFRFLPAVGEAPTPKYYEVKTTASQHKALTDLNLANKLRGMVDLLSEWTRWDHCSTSGNPMAAKMSDRDGFAEHLSVSSSLPSVVFRYHELAGALGFPKTLADTSNEWLDVLHNQPNLWVEGSNNNMFLGLVDSSDLQNACPV